MKHWPDQGAPLPPMVRKSLKMDRLREWCTSVENEEVSGEWKGLNGKHLAAGRDLREFVIVLVGIVAEQGGHDAPLAISRKAAVASVDKSKPAEESVGRIGAVIIHGGSMASFNIIDK
jgi:hypothetical protein